LLEDGMGIQISGVKSCPVQAVFEDEYIHHNYCGMVLLVEVWGSILIFFSA